MRNVFLENIKTNWLEHWVTVQVLVFKLKTLNKWEGGIVLTNDIVLAENIRKVQSLGYAGVSAKKSKITKLDIQDPNYLRHTSMGWNYRMPELCCAVALAQVERIDELVDIRIKCSNLFTDVTKEFSEWFVPQLVEENYTSSYWTWATVLKRDDITWHDIRVCLSKMVVMEYMLHGN